MLQMQGLMPLPRKVRTGTAGLALADASGSTPARYGLAQSLLFILWLPGSGVLFPVGA